MYRLIELQAGEDIELVPHNRELVERQLLQNHFELYLRCLEVGIVDPCDTGLRLFNYLLV